MSDRMALSDIPTPERHLLTLPIERINASQLHLRLDLDPNSIQELAESIRQYGLINPISVRLARGGCYELISGERRLRALVTLGMHFVDAFVINACDMEAALLQVVENLQREELHYLEEAEAYRAIIRDHHLSQVQLAERIGRSQPMVANRLRLLNLPQSVRSELRRHGLSERHARALLKLNGGEAAQLDAVTMAVQRKLNVRQFEELILRINGQPKRNVKLLIRDQRVFINTVMESVKVLRKAGVDASGRVIDDVDKIEVIVTLHKLE